MIDLEKEREAFKQKMLNEHSDYENEEEFEKDKHGDFFWIGTDSDFTIWQMCAEEKQAEINDLKQQLAEAHASRASWVEYSQKLESGEFTLIENKKLTTWYLDEPEGMYWDFDGIDGAFSNLDGGQVIKVERLRNFTVPEVYVTRTWEDGDVGYWKEYATKEEAEKVAKHCKAMIEAVEKDS